MKVNKNDRIDFLYSFLVISILLISCKDCPLENDKINFGFYQSTVVEDDYIELLPNNKYIHSVQSLDYNKSGSWIKGDNCKIYLEQFSQVINKFDTTTVDSSRVGSYSFFLTKEGLETPESYEGYKYIGKEIK